MNQHMISIANDFSKFPAGRYREDGPYPGESFREEVLIPALRKAIHSNYILVVNIDGTMGFGSSFLEEAFGGLIRSRAFSKSDIQHKLAIESNLKSYKDLIWKYISEAK